MFVYQFVFFSTLSDQRYNDSSAILVDRRRFGGAARLLREKNDQPDLKNKPNYSLIYLKKLYSTDLIQPKVDIATFITKKLYQYKSICF